jgi:hypothetical protein
MAIGRISGPMLFANLERQGVDLSIEGNLIYFDVNRKRIGINTNNPEFDVHITGYENTQANLFVNGNIIASEVTITDEYTLPTIKGPAGTVITSDGSGQTYWGEAGGGAQIERKQWSYQISDLPAGAFAEFDIDIGIASIVYNLTVNRPVLVEVYATALKNETNPYTFLSTLGHLTDDGTVLLNDGSVIQQRQYSIFANQETPAQNRVYGRITNIDGVAGPVTLDLTYFSAVTDNVAGNYETNVVNTLPPYGYTGETVLLVPANNMYVWYNNTWNQVT